MGVICKTAIDLLIIAPTMSHCIPKMMSQFWKSWQDNMHKQDSVVRMRSEEQPLFLVHLGEFIWWKKECHWKCDCTYFIFCYRKSRKIGAVILVLCFLVIRQEFDPEREEWRKSIWALDIMIEIWNTMEPAADLGIWLKQGTSWIFDFKYSYFIPNFFQYHKVFASTHFD